MTHDWKNLNSQNLNKTKKNLNKTNWDENLQKTENNVNVSFNNYLDTIDTLISKHAPMKKA